MTARTFLGCACLFNVTAVFAMVCAQTACKPLPAKTGPDAVALAACVGDELLKGDTDPATIALACHTDEVALVGDIVQSLEKRATALAAKKACGSAVVDGGKP